MRRFILLDRELALFRYDFLVYQEGVSDARESIIEIVNAGGLELLSSCESCVIKLVTLIYEFNVAWRDIDETKERKCIFY